MPNLPTNLILMDWLLTNGLRLVLIVVLACVAAYVIRAAAKKAVHHAVEHHCGQLSEGDVKRAKTLTRVITRTIVVAIAIAVGMMALSEFGVDIGPLIAGAGIIGLAIGLGAQTLIRDAIAGLFILLENQFSVGDRIELDNLRGEVMDITLRRTVIRDDAGGLHSVPNGEIDRSANFSKANAHVHVTLPVSYTADIDRIITLMNRAGAELSADPAMKKNIKKQFVFDRVESFGDSTIVLSAVGDTVSTARGEVEGAYRLRLFEALKEEGIAIR